MTAAPVKSFAKKATIYAAGDRGGALPKLLSGAVILFALLDDGRRQVLDLAGPGDFLHFETDGEVDHYAEALTPCEVAFFPAGDLLASPDGPAFLLEQMRDRLAIERRHVAMLSQRGASERLEAFVRLAADCLGAEAGRLDLPLTRQQIADFTGLTLETVSRTFAQWEREDVVTKLSGRTYQLCERLAA
jgi:CRP-like cAMP-binding protein